MNHESELALEFWTELSDQLNILISVGSTEACIMILKSLQDFLSNPMCLQLFLSCEEEGRNILLSLADYLANELESQATSDTTKGKTISTADRNKTIKLLKICPMIIETFQKMFSQANL